MSLLYIALFGLLINGSRAQSDCVPDSQALYTCTDAWYEDEDARRLFETVKAERCQYYDYSVIPHIVELALQGTAQVHVDNLNQHYNDHECIFKGDYRWYQDEYRQNSCCANPAVEGSLESCTFKMPKCLYRESTYVPGETIEVVLRSETPLNGGELNNFLYNEIQRDDSLAVLLRDTRYTHIGIAGRGGFISIYLSKNLGSEVCNQCFCAPANPIEPTVTGPATVTYFTDGTATVTKDPTVTYFTTEEIITVTGPAMITYFTAEGTATVTIDPAVTYFTTEEIITVTGPATVTYFTETTTTTCPTCTTLPYCAPIAPCILTTAASTPTHVPELRLLEETTQSYGSIKGLLKPFLARDSLVKEVPEDIWKEVQKVSKSDDVPSFLQPFICH